MDKPLNSCNPAQYWVLGSVLYLACLIFGVNVSVCAWSCCFYLFLSSWTRHIMYFNTICWMIWNWKLKNSPWIKICENAGLWIINSEFQQKPENQEIWCLQKKFIWYHGRLAFVQHILIDKLSENWRWRSRLQFEKRYLISPPATLREWKTEVATTVIVYCIANRWCI